MSVAIALLTTLRPSSSLFGAHSANPSRSLFVPLVVVSHATSPWHLLTRCEKKSSMQTSALPMLFVKVLMLCESTGIPMPYRSRR